MRITNWDINSTVLINVKVKREINKKNFYAKIQTAITNFEDVQVAFLIVISVLEFAQ